MRLTEKQGEYVLEEICQCLSVLLEGSVYHRFAELFHIGRVHRGNFLRRVVMENEIRDYRKTDTCLPR